VCIENAHSSKHGKVRTDYNGTKKKEDCVDTFLTDVSFTASGVFRGRRGRHLPRAPPWGVTCVNFPYFWWKTYYSLI